MAEWSIAAVLKTVEVSKPPGVRIPLPPQTFFAVTAYAGTKKPKPQSSLLEPGLRLFGQAAGHPAKNVLASGYCLELFYIVFFRRRSLETRPNESGSVVWKLR